MLGRARRRQGRAEALALSQVVLGGSCCRPCSSASSVAFDDATRLVRLDALQAEMTLTVLDEVALAFARGRRRRTRRPAAARPAAARPATARPATARPATARPAAALGAALGKVALVQADPAAAARDELCPPEQVAALKEIFMELAGNAPVAEATLAADQMMLFFEHLPNAHGAACAAGRGGRARALVTRARGRAADPEPPEGGGRVSGTKLRAPIFRRSGARARARTPSRTGTRPPTRRATAS